ncbi:hypothetical protein WJ97_13320 [Burkholderia ubonensis]|nr:hypothetical protein WJ97_13320 [Burkholderia ubonensis]
MRLSAVLRAGSCRRTKALVGRRARVRAAVRAQVAEMRLTERAALIRSDLAVLVRVHLVEALGSVLQELLTGERGRLVVRSGGDARRADAFRGECGQLLRESAGCGCSKDGCGQELLVHMWSISSEQAHACVLV